MRSLTNSLYTSFLFCFCVVGWTPEQVQSFGNEARLIHHTCGKIAIENYNVRQLLIGLVKLGLNPTLPDLDGNTPFHVAAKAKNVECFKDLIFITSGFMRLPSLPSELWHKIIFQVCV